MPRLLIVLTISTAASLATFASAVGLKLEPQKHESPADLEKFDLHITGEVSRGQSFEQDIGHGLIFHLVPPSNDETAGWIIEIAPKNQPDDGPIEFSSIATPPYHTYNERDIAAVYGRTGRDVVALKDRTFFFVHSVDDEHRAEEVVNAALYPTRLSDEERVRVAAEKTEIRLGKGEFRILKARINHGRTMNDPGGIDWLRFELNIEFSSGLTMANIIARVAQQQ